MTSIKIMLLGVLFVLVGLSLATGIAQLAALQVALPIEAINTLPLVGFILVLAGFLVGVAGFFQKN